MKAYCDGHMDKVVSAVFLLQQTYFILKDFLFGSVFLSLRGQKAYHDGHTGVFFRILLLIRPKIEKCLLCLFITFFSSDLKK